jgi:hypothetical protein
MAPKHRRYQAATLATGIDTKVASYFAVDVLRDNNRYLLDFVTHQSVLQIGYFRLCRLSAGRTQLLSVADGKGPA